MTGEVEPDREVETAYGHASGKVPRDRPAYPGTGPTGEALDDVPDIAPAPDLPQDPDDDLADRQPENDAERSRDPRAERLDHADAASDTDPGSA